MSDLEKSDSKGDNPDKLLTALEAIADSYKDPHGFVFAKKPESNLNPYNEKIEFQKLTPIVLENLPKGYKDALDFVFDNKTNPDVTNIAVTGSYGSGKTSIIKSYEDHFHKKSTGKEFTYISLASFDMPPNNACDLKENNSTKDETNFNTSLHHLEEKVINHLVHQISPEQIPLSRFKIYRTSSNKNAIYIAIYSILLLVTSYLVNDWIINKNHLENSHFSTILTAPIFPWFTPIALFFPLFLFLKLSWLVLFGWLTLLGFGIYYLVTNLQNYRVRKKLALGGSEIELFDEPNDSRFDKYMNEIIYIFEKAKIETVIIEDLDRFDKCSPHLFTRLRELNLLLNKRRAKKEEPIRFLYLIRDDIFTTENRTKFFDFILPVIPVITYQNSFEKAFELFTKSPYYFKDCDTPGIDERFLEIICPYIKDLRVIKNIYNEFHIYYQPIVIKAKLIPTKLLAIIAYKNLFPKDFSDLLNNKGFLYEIFNTPLPKAKDLTEKEILEGFIKNNFSSMTCEKLENQLDALTAVTLSKSQNYKLADPPFEITKHYIKKLRKLDKVWYIDARTGLITSTSFSNFCRLLGTEFDDFDSSVDQLEKKIEEHRNFNYSMLKHYHKEVETIPTLLIAHEVT